MTRRRWIASEWSDTTALLTGADAVHLARVLRAVPGTQFDVVTGSRVWRATITDVEEKCVSFRLEEEMDADKALPLTLLLSIYKFDRMEWAIEKAVELGVARIVPVISRRTEKHLAQAAPKRLERWRRIALEAAKQSRRSDVPEIAETLTLSEYLQKNVAGEEIRILLAEHERSLSLLQVLEQRSDSAAVTVAAIGPEGGWTEDEVKAFAGAEWVAVSLGPRILRAETAAIATLAIFSAWHR